MPRGASSSSPRHLVRRHRQGGEALNPPRERECSGRPDRCIIIRLRRLDHIWVGLPPAENATTWTKPVSSPRVRASSWLAVRPSLPPPLSSRDRRNHSRTAQNRPTDRSRREDHLDRRQASIGFHAAAAARLSSACLPARSNRPSIFFFFLLGATAPGQQTHTHTQHVAAAVVALAFLSFTPSL